MRECGAAHTLARRDCKGYYFSGLYHDLLADRCPVTPNRVSQEAKRCPGSYQIAWHLKGFGRISGGCAEPNPLSPIDGVNHHVSKSLIFDLEHGLVIRAGVGLGRPAAARRREEDEGYDMRRPKE